MGPSNKNLLMFVAHVGVLDVLENRTPEREAIRSGDESTGKEAVGAIQETLPGHQLISKVEEAALENAPTADSVGRTT